PMSSIGVRGGRSRLPRSPDPAPARACSVRTATAVPPRIAGVSRRTGTILIRRLSGRMSIIAWVVYVSAAVPLSAATRAYRNTTLLHSVVWAWLAWLGWGLALVAADGRWDYAALCLIGCAGVAVLGARR